MTDTQTPEHQIKRPGRKRALIAGAVTAGVLALSGGITTVALATTPAAADTAQDAPPTGAPTGMPTGSPPSGAPTAGSSSSSSGSASAPTPGQFTHQPRLDGTVLSVNGTTILIKDGDGFTRTIVTSSATKYADGLTATPAVGATIDAVGTVDSNHTSLDATSIGKGHTGAPGGSGGPGRSGGQGGPGGSGGPGQGGPGASSSSSSSTTSS